MPLRLTLVALPWSSTSRPSAALGALAAYARDGLPDAIVRSRSEYATIAAALGDRLYTHIAEGAYQIGELLYQPLLYPERRGAVLAAAATSLAEVCPRPELLLASAASFEEVAAHVIAELDRSLDELAADLVRDADVVGMTTCFGQLFGNIALCEKLKRRDKAIRTLLGGSTVSARVGPSIIAEYASVDFVIQGEGERPLVALAQALTNGEPVDQIAGLLTRDNAAGLPNGAALWEVEDMDDLPLPDFDEYAERAAQHGISWRVPIEGSRGCWWDRVYATKDPHNTCYFCNLNVQWKGYRQKSNDRVIAELAALADRYRNGDFFFLDNIIRHKGIEELARGIAALGMDLSFFYEMRANVSPWHLLLLREAGLTETQFGIEALSSSVLRRVGKGTTCIQNLEAMKTCVELGIRNQANLILDFPTSTAEEVAETVRVIDDYAVCYQVLDTTSFHLGVGSTAEVRREEFGVEEVRNSDLYRVGLPDEVWSRLRLLDLSFGRAAGGVDWTPVAAAVARWRQRQADHRGVERALVTYQDGQTFLRIRDRRGPDVDVILEGAARELYLFCGNIRRFDKICARFGATRVEDRHQVKATLDRLVTARLVFEEGDRYLSIAVAQSVAAATRRIRASREQGHEPQAETTPPGSAPLAPASLVRPRS